ncbi:MAG: bifunctional enoyl-CoA hydratase/phosphate acetyltransferase [Alphaproteobacteria bacterium]|nr:bifunctional enoyl-CoA hydratase/phosphate acetyltransferase [Alphaproteobacteria bacterium]
MRHDPKPSANRYEAILNQAKSLRPRRTAIVQPTDIYSLGGAIEAAKAELLTPLLVGPAAKIKAAADELGEDISGFELFDVPHSHAAAERAVELVHEGAAKSIVKGAIHTDELLRPILSRAKGIRTERRLSHTFVIDAPNYHKFIFITDAAINIEPDLKAKADILQNAIELAHALGIKLPKVAILSAVEMVNPNIPSTIDAAALCKMADRKQIRGAIIDGPLAFDNAISAEAARIKGISSPVAGDPDILLVPDLETGNMLYKQLEYLARAESAGIALGAKVPIILTSRADNLHARLCSCALAQLYYAYLEREKFSVAE